MAGGFDAEPRRTAPSRRRTHACKVWPSFELLCRRSVNTEKKLYDGRRNTMYKGGRAHGVPSEAAHNKNRLREQTVETESRRRSALIGFDTNLKRQVAAAATAAAAAAAAATAVRTARHSGHKSSTGRRTLIQANTSELRSP